MKASTIQVESVKKSTPSQLQDRLIEAYFACNSEISEILAQLQKKMQIVEAEELASFKKLQVEPEKQIQNQIEKGKIELQNLQNKITHLKKQQINQTKTDIH